MGVELAITDCCACGATFACDAERVPSILWDPLTGLPPDVAMGDTYGTPLRAANGAPVTIDVTPEAHARALRRGVCPACAKRINDIHRTRPGYSGGFHNEEDTAARIVALLGDTDRMP